MPCAEGELCAHQPDSTPQDPHGHRCQGGCGGRLHGICGSIFDDNNENHRICSACVAKAGKRKAPAADSAGKAQSKRPKARNGGSFFSSHFYFPASGQAVVTSVVPSSPRFLPSIFIAHRVQQSQCSSVFQSSVANSRSRAFRKSICAQEKVPTNLYEYALVGARTHDTDLYQARG